MNLVRSPYVQAREMTAILLSKQVVEVQSHRGTVTEDQAAISAHTYTRQANTTLASINNGHKACNPQPCIIQAT